MVTAIFPQGVWAQRTGGPSLLAAGNTMSRFPSSADGQSNGQPPGSLVASIYLFGKVMLDDGTPPPQGVTIERICGAGSPRAQAYTDLKGQFGFQTGRTFGVLQDASEAESARPGTQFSDCDLRAVLSGFSSDTIPMGGKSFTDDGNLGTIVLHRLANVEGSAVSATTLQAPRPARRAYQRALLYLQKDNLSEAGKQLLKAVQIYPNYAAAWHALGKIQERNGDVDLARNSFAKAIAADARFTSPYPKLAELEANAGDWAKVADITRRLLKLDAVDYPMAYLYNAIANLKLGQFDSAEKSARTGEKLDTSHRYPQLEQVLAIALGRKRDYAEAAIHLRSYLLLAPDAADAARMKNALAELERRSGAHD
jgi:tetratricopeptide (TPR) repeat protein